MIWEERLSVVLVTLTAAVGVSLCAWWLHAPPGTLLHSPSLRP
jgi:hypothetical protein